MQKNRANDHSKYRDWIDPNQVVPYERNAKQHTEKQIRNIANSIRRFGWQQDTVITSDNVLVIGHGRRLAALKLGCEMPYHRIDKTADQLTDGDIRELRIADNQTNAETGFDLDVLALDTDGLEFEGFEFDFGIAGADAIASENDIVEDVPPELPAEPVTKPDDIWQLGRHRLMCGDSTDSETVERLMDSEKADMVFTDPPFGVNVRGGKGKGNMIAGDLTQTAIPFSFEIAVTQATKKKAHFYFCGAEANLQLYEKLFDRYLHILPKHLIWAKNGFVMKQNGYHNQYEIIYHGYKEGSGGLWYGGRTEDEASDVWHIKRDASSTYVHPTQKPIEIPARAIRNSCPPGGICLDMFGGSGSTLIACEQLNRTCYMMELDPHYCDVIIRRWENLTGEKAVLLNDPARTA